MEIWRSGLSTPCSSHAVASFAFWVTMTVETCWPGLHCFRTLPAPREGLPFFLVVRARAAHIVPEAAISSSSRSFRGEYLYGSAVASRLSLFANRRGRRMRVLLLFLLSLTTCTVAVAQDPTKVDPAHYRVMFENAHMRVLEHRDKSGDEAPMHSHPAYMTNVTGAGKHADTLPNGQTIIEEAVGSKFDWHPPTTHAGQNIGHGHTGATS